MAFRITGGTGLLGRYFTEVLQEHGSDYTVLSRKLGAQGVDSHRIQTDYSKTSLETIFQEDDVIVHLAGGRGPQQDISAYTEELQLAENIFEAAQAKKCKKVIVASSISIYADPDRLPWHENSAVEDVPKSLYGLNKKYIEALTEYYSVRFGLDIICLRFSHLFGANEKNNYMINYFMRLAYLGQPLTVMGASDVEREFLYAKDAAQAIWQASQHNAKSLVLNVKGSETLTNLEVAETINRVFDNQEPIKRKDEDVSDFFAPSYMDGTRAEEEIAYTPNYQFSEALQEIYQEMERLDDELPEKY
ncbi:NAD-dependent epimerase/dehydratase family protein [Staphylococcus carnosus]|uniref:NAD-dependent epimerase/dehydratase family protein n=1 Tax=Staphylococcus carnosus TaxID=1281 RepID=UPI0020A298BA|nr:NAD(P)-dependent oxidoreductase [Staphylococcus carnosus]UTB79757.1 UDP-glucose 4-epimerase [Staphylococcus carnosus]